MKKMAELLGGSRPVKRDNELASDISLLKAKPKKYFSLEPSLYTKLVSLENIKLSNYWSN
jgi:hypothetical protein